MGTFLCEVGPSKVRVSKIKVFKGSPSIGRAAVAHRSVICMAYVDGTIDLCSAQPARLYEVIMDTRLGRGQRGVNSGCGKSPERTLVTGKQSSVKARRTEQIHSAPKSQVLVLCLLTVQQGRQPCTQRTGVSGGGYDKGYSSGQKECNGGHGKEGVGNPK